jgi:D-alanyl-D-alanine carboxypeptidase
VSQYRVADSGDGAIEADLARQTQLAAAFRAHLCTAVADVLRTGEAPGAAIALVADGQRVLTAGVGHRDLGRLRPLGAEARFYAYSITKVFLAVALLRLVEQGQFALDDPIQAILPEVPLVEPVTLRQLLNHTGGLPDYGALPEYRRAVRANPDRPWSADEFLARTLRGGALFPPGHGWAYSNIGFLLVRQAIARITQRSLRDTLVELVFRPAGLRQTVVAESLEDGQGLTPGYSTQLDADEAFRDVTRRYHPGWVAHGVAISTASDLARAVEALFGGRLLGPGSLAAMLEAAPVPGAHPPFIRPGYGLGLMVDLGSPYGRVAGHAGGGPGYSTAAFHFPDVLGQRLTSVALVNRDQPDLGTEIAFTLVRAYADHPGRRSAD